MSAVLGTPIVDSAACDNGDIRIFTDIKIIVYHLGKTSLTENYRDMDTLPLCTGFYDNIDSRAVLLRDNINSACGIPLYTLAVGPDIIGPCGNCVEICHFFQQMLLYCVHLFHLHLIAGGSVGILSAEKIRENLIPAALSFNPAV